MLDSLSDDQPLVRERSAHHMLLIEGSTLTIPFADVGETSWADVAGALYGKSRENFRYDLGRQLMHSVFFVSGQRCRLL